MQLDKKLLPNAPPPAIQPKAPERTEINYPFSTGPVLQEEYRNPWGAVRIGKLLEDLDSLAGNIAFKHVDDGSGKTKAPLLVTASVDAITLRHALSMDEDIVMAGRVAWTGTSSMDIRMEIVQKAYRDDPSLVAWFTFVARDPVTQKAMRVSPVVPQTDVEKERYAERQLIADERRAARRTQPDVQQQVLAENREWAQEQLVEAQAMQDLPALASASAVLMSQTGLQNTFICQPQQRNMHGRVFGGFLMRRAYELAFATAYMFAGSRPIFVEVDEVTFQRPVDVGDLLRFKSCILHTQPGTNGSRGYIHAQVIAYITQPEKVVSNISNTFNFVFAVDPSHSTTLPEADRQLKRVLPSTPAEAQSIERYYPGRPAETPSLDAPMPWRQLVLDAHSDFQRYLKGPAYHATFRQPKQVLSDRGIVIPAGGAAMLKNAAATIKLLRDHHHCQLPILIAHNGAAENQFADVTFFDMASTPYPPHHRKIPISGVLCKAYAAYLAPFHQFVLMDADTLLLRNPEYLFKTQQLIEAGNLNWPDYWVHGYLPHMDIPAPVHLLSLQNMQIQPSIRTACTSWSSLL
ncbi:hypothetical protein WJX72_012385 [[Myrmecia] bisecta]|uniref:HotDog ACOT-type domain-containing protein n=1 Tax=[Myrmecia] bisecta TaxID=41462 RepID=A0AAW1PRK4_9CHLO